MRVSISRIICPGFEFPSKPFYELTYYCLDLQISTLTHPVHSLYCGGDQSFVLCSSDAQHVNGYLPTICDYREYKPESQICKITNQLMSQIVSATEPADQDIMSLAEVVFASPASWNASFLLPDGQHIPSTWKNMGVDLVMVSNSVPNVLIVDCGWKLSLFF